MGRRLGLVGKIVREMERAAARSTADARRRLRRMEAMTGRALERELVRQERAAAREALRDERAQERARLANERGQAQLAKQEAREAQLTAWRLECEEHQERDRDIDSIGNDAPEVEDRDQFYEELLQPQTFEEEPFAPPSLPSLAKPLAQLQLAHRARVDAALRAFQPAVRPYRLVRAGCGALLLGAVAALLAAPEEYQSAALAAAMAAVVGLIAAGALASRAQRHQFEAHSKATEENATEHTVEEQKALSAQHRAQTAHLIAQAQAAHAAALTEARNDFDANEQERIAALRRMCAGDVREIARMLDEVLPLDLPVDCRVAFTIHSASAISLDLELPEPSVLPQTEAKLLASGKVAYKEKPARRLQEQYVRLIAGLALRYASEVMLNVPTCQAVEVRGYRNLIEPSLGVAQNRLVFEVKMDYPTLKPMTMPDIDPVAALQHFPHRINLDRSRGLLPL